MRIARICAIAGYVIIRGVGSNLKVGPEHQRQKGRGDVGAEGAEFEEGVPFPTEKSGDDDAPLPRIFF